MTGAAGGAGRPPAATGTERQTAYAARMRARGMVQAMAWAPPAAAADLREMGRMLRAGAWAGSGAPGGGGAPAEVAGWAVRELEAALAALPREERAAAALSAAVRALAAADASDAAAGMGGG